MANAAIRTEGTVIRSVTGKLYPNAAEKKAIERQFAALRVVKNAIVELCLTYGEGFGPDYRGRLNPCDPQAIIRQLTRKTSRQTLRGPRRDQVDVDAEIDRIVDAKLTKFWDGYNKRVKEQAVFGKTPARPTNAQMETRSKRFRKEAEQAVERHEMVTVETPSLLDDPDFAWILDSLSQDSIAYVVEQVIKKSYPKYKSNCKQWLRDQERVIAKGTEFHADNPMDADEAMRRRVNADRVKAGKKRLPRTEYQKTCDKFAGQQRAPRFHKIAMRYTGYRDDQSVRNRIGTALRNNPNKRVIDDGRILIPKIGPIKIRINDDLVPDAKQYRSITVTRRGNDYFAIVTYERFVADTHARPHEYVGIDIGTQVPLALSDGYEVAYPVTEPNPRLERLKRRLNRQQSLLGPGKKWSNRMKKRKALITNMERAEIAKRNTLQDQVAHDLATQYGRIAMEDINFQMLTQSAAQQRRSGKKGKTLTNKHQANLNRTLLATAPARFKLQLKSKCEETTTEFVEVDPAYTSQTCSSCLHKSAKSRVTREVFHCTNCGTRKHADINAAEMIAIRAFGGETAAYY